MKRLLGMVALALVLTGCQAEAEPRKQRSAVQEQEEPTPDPSPMKPAWTKNMPVVGQPEMVGGVAVVLTARGDNWKIHGIDPATGKQLWRHPYSPLSFSPRAAQAPVGTKDDRGHALVAFRSPKEIRGIRVPVVVVRPRTGRIVTAWQAASEVGYRACPDGTDLCVDGWYYYSLSPATGQGNPGPVTGGSSPERWDLDDPKQKRHPLPGPDTAYLVDDETLFATRTLPERLASVRGGNTRWVRSLKRLVGARAGMYAWSFGHVEESDVYVGGTQLYATKAEVARYERGKPMRFGYRKFFQVVGLDGRSGERLWRVPSANAWCDQGDTSLKSPVLCVLQGEVVEQKGRKPRRTGHGIELRAVDARTGEKRWSYDMEADFARRVTADGLTIHSPDDTSAVVLEGGPAVIDLETGERSSIDPALVTFCSGFNEKVGTRVERTGGTVLHHCTMDGRRTSKPVSAWAVSSLEGSGRWRLISTEGRLVAYDVRDCPRC